MKIAIASGKGGTGKTFVSVNLFSTLHKMHKHVSLIDCDVEVPNALAFIPSSSLFEEKVVSEYRPVFDRDKCTFCNKCVEYCTYHAITCIPSLHYIKLLSDFCHGCAACSVACKSDAIKDSSTIAGIISTYTYQNDVCLAEGRMTTGHPSPVPLIKLATGDLFGNKYQYTLYDSPPGTSCPFIQTIVKADYVVLVTEPTPFGLSDLRQAIETLQTLGKPFGIIINRAGLGNRDVYHYLEKNKFALLAEIPLDEEIARLYSEGKIVIDDLPQLDNIFKDLANKLITHGNCYN